MTAPAGGKAPEGGDNKATEGGKSPEAGEKTFTQAELDAKISERLNRERQSTATKYADYDALKAAAEVAKTSDQKLAELQEQLVATQRDALRRTVQADYGISTEDAELFLTGADKETLEKQAQRLKARDDDRAKNGGRVPGEGHNGRPKISDDKQAVRTLFGRQ